MTAAHSSKLKRNLHTTHNTPAKKIQTLDTTSAESTWEGIHLASLAEILSTAHPIKTVFKEIALTVSLELGDQAVAIVLINKDLSLQILGEDGIHDALRAAIRNKSDACRFLANPEISIPDLLGETPASEETLSTYEFIEHYWGARIHYDLDYAIYLMAFGSEKAQPSEKFIKLADFASRISNNCYPDKKLAQLTSDLAAQVQGRRMSVSNILATQLAKWTPINDSAR